MNSKTVLSLGILFESLTYLLINLLIMVLKLLHKYFINVAIMVIRSKNYKNNTSISKVHQLYLVHLYLEIALEVKTIFIHYCKISTPEPKCHIIVPHIL